VLVLHRRHDRQHTCRQQVAGRHARLRPARPEATALGVAIFADHQHRAAPLAADGETLDEPQQDEQQRRVEADHAKCRKQADQESRAAHQYQAGHQELLASDPVAQVAEYKAAQGPGDEHQRIGREGQHGPG
jgi:hypothetical protein